MTGLRDLLASERGVFALLSLALVTLFVLLGLMPVADWLGFVKHLAALLIASKTVTTAAESWRERAPIPPARVVE